MSTDKINLMNLSPAELGEFFVSIGEKSFRSQLCNLLGNDVEKGLLPDDRELLGKMVEDISYNNARRYFKFY